jgi:hypothetical protein
MNSLYGLLVLLCLWVYRMTRCVLAGLGLAALLGPLAAATLVLACAALRFQWPLRLLAAYALWHRWHWPLWAALLVAVPRLWLLLPGLITVALARLRHPRPTWPALTEAQAPIPPGT